MSTKGKASFRQMKKIGSYFLLKKVVREKVKKVEMQEVSVWNVNWPIWLNYWEWEGELWECSNFEEPWLLGLHTLSQVLYIRITEVSFTMLQIKANRAHSLENNLTSIQCTHMCNWTGPLLDSPPDTLILSSPTCDLVLHVPLVSPFVSREDSLF